MLFFLTLFNNENIIVLKHHSLYKKNMFSAITIYATVM